MTISVRCSLRVVVGNTAGDRARNVPQVQEQHPSAPGSGAAASAAESVADGSQLTCRCCQSPSPRPRHVPPPTVRDCRGPDGAEIDFRPPFKRVRMLPALEEALGVELPRNLSSPETTAMLSELCDRHGILCTPPATPARLLDKLVGAFVEGKCVHPTFVIDHPAIMSPLARAHRNDSRVTERFELFINGLEYCNAYSEQNDAAEQRLRFMEQGAAAAAGDEEAQVADEDFCVALEHGLPPTAGWGLGIDRLTMLLANVTSIKEVLLFPAMKPQ